MIRFYRAIIESILTFSIVVWFSHANQEEKQQLEPTVKGASRIIGRELSFIESNYHAHCARKSRSIARDTTHPANHCTGNNPPSQPLHGIQPTQPTISLSFFPLVNATEASRLEQQGLRTYLPAGCETLDQRGLPRAITLSSASAVLMFLCRRAYYTHLTTCVCILLFYCFLGNVQTAAMVHSYKLLLLYYPTNLVLLCLET